MKRIIVLILLFNVIMSTLTYAKVDIFDNEIKELKNILYNFNPYEMVKDIQENKTDKVFTNGIYYYLDTNKEIIKDLRNHYVFSKYAIALNRKMATVTIYGYNKDENKYNIPVVSFPCSPNKSVTPIGNYYTSDVYNGWHKMFGNCYAQYCIRFNKHFLFHSVIYSEPDSYSLLAKTYNGLMTGVQSTGCIRLRSGDAYWLVNNVGSNSPVIVYDSDFDGPLGRPTFDLIPLGQNYDPTDPKV